MAFPVHYVRLTKGITVMYLNARALGSLKSLVLQHSSYQTTGLCKVLFTSLLFSLDTNSLGIAIVLTKPLSYQNLGI